MGGGQENILGTVAGHSEGAPHEDMPQIPIPEAESDDEYEVIPSRKEKQTKDLQGDLKTERAPQAASGTKETTFPKGGGDADESEDSDEGPQVDEGNKTGEGDSEPPAAVNDDDWLRSRTSRLLDFIDPDDVPSPKKSDTTTTPSQELGAAKDTPEEAEPPDGVIEAVTPDQPVTETPSTPDTLDIIRRTSRLFVRNLPYGATEDDLREEFGKFGAIEEVRAGFDSCYAFPILSLRLHDEPQIGTTYTPVYDVNLGEKF